MLQLLTDLGSSSAVKRHFLSGVSALCIFMMRQNVNDSLLPLLITFLNDRDPALRCCFFESITAVCAFVGRASLQAFVLPGPALAPLPVAPAPAAHRAPHP